jgi:hypothetical protein
MTTKKTKASAAGARKAPKGQKAKTTEETLLATAPGGAVPDPDKLPRKKKKTPEWVKRAADRAEKRSKGEDPESEAESPQDKKGTKTAKRASKKAEASGPSAEEIAAHLEAMREEAYKPKLGRPSKYKPEYAAVARALCKRGATDFELAQEFNVDVTTIWRWKVAYDDFSQALQIHKEDFDAQVERSLALRANGFTIETEKVFCHMGRVTRAKVLEYIPPDVSAARLWLTNRRPDKWRDKTATELTGKDGGAIEFKSTARERVATKLAEIARKQGTAG